MSAMNRPKDIIDLDSIPYDFWHVDANCAHIYRGEIWDLVKYGCAECVDMPEGDHKSKTLRRTDEHGKDVHVCLTHGDLAEVPYLIKQTYSVSIGGQSRYAEKVDEDCILVPTRFTEAEKNKTIERLISDLDKAKRIEMGNVPEPEEIDEDDLD